MSDKAYFDAIAAVFLRNIYQNPKGAVRLAILQRDLMPYVQTDKALTVLDVGGGSSPIGLWLASLGHEVWVVDVAEELLNEGRKVAEQSALFNIHFQHGNAFELSELLGEKRFDVVCCHAVLEWVSEGFELLQVLNDRLKPEGILSLLFYNQSALHFAQHVFGNFHYIDRGFVAKRKSAKLTPQYAKTPEQVAQWLDDLGLKRLVRSPVRCFYDYMKSQDRERHTVEELVAREMALAQDECYLAVARYVHEVRRGYFAS
ncbi:MAG: methyltransferase domain-containing protein [Cardiobacteriaceae bacterium]|nr:methyltransferase domain-containing protein [Cardiobacteriaceae bacterium]